MVVAALPARRLQSRSQATIVVNVPSQAATCHSGTPLSHGRTHVAFGAPAHADELSFADGERSALDELDWTAADSFRDAAGKKVKAAEPLQLLSVLGGTEIAASDTAAFR